MAGVSGPLRAAFGSSFGGRWTGWRLGVPAIFAMAGFLFTTSSVIAGGTDLRSEQTERLADHIRITEQANSDLQDEIIELRRSVDALAEVAGSEGADEAREQARSLIGPAGFESVTGPALTVALDDAPQGALNKSYPGLIQPVPDDLVVHQQDLQAVINALWAAGAQAIQLMDQRLISTSAVRCAGNVLILQQRVYSPPYVVTAVGDQEKMLAALNESAGVQAYLDYVDAYGLGWQVQRHNQVTVPAYSGSIELRYAEVGT